MLPGLPAGAAPPEAPPARPDLPAATLDAPPLGGTRYPRPNGQDYLSRTIGGYDDVVVLRRLRERSSYVLLTGDPGVGKTALVEAAFPDLVTVQCSGDMTVPHLVGAHLPTDTGGWRWHDGPLVTALREGRPLYLDELNMLPPEVSTVLHSVMDGRGTLRIDDLPGSPPVAAAPGFYVAASYNPGRLRVRHPSEALLSRFGVRIEAATDFDAARALGVLEEFVTIAENLQLRNTTDRATGGAGLWVPQMRELLGAQALIDAGFGAAFAADALVSQCPWPEDLPEVAQVADHVLGRPVQPLQLGRQS